MTYLLIIISSLLAAAAVFLFIRIRERSIKMSAMEKKLSDNELEIRNRIAQAASDAERIASLTAKIEADRKELEQLKESLRSDFRNLANEIMEEKSNQFKQTNKESMEALLNPFKNNIKDFRERVEQIYSFENNQRGELKAEIKNLLSLNQRITEETTQLTNALKGNSKVQGDWGEMILETILESSNLVRGVHYKVQETLKNEDGANVRPDVILELPHSKQIVIDSKVSLTSFVNYTSSDDAAQRKTLINMHADSVRSHVKELSAKKYQTLVNSPDFVIMFIPNEPAFMAALQCDNTIWSEAYNKKVIISSPTNLFALLKIVDDLWRRDTQNRNALDIAESAGALYDKFMNFADSFEDLGKNIESASRNYNMAMDRLKRGTGNLVGRTEKLRKMGAKASKKLSAAFSDFDSEE